MVPAAGGTASGTAQANADIDLFVNVPDTSDADEASFVAAIGCGRGGDAQPVAAARSGGARSLPSPT